MKPPARGLTGTSEHDMQPMLLVKLSSMLSINFINAYIVLHYSYTKYLH